MSAPTPQVVARFALEANDFSDLAGICRQYNMTVPEFVAAVTKYALDLHVSGKVTPGDSVADAMDTYVFGAQEVLARLSHATVVAESMLTDAKMLLAQTAAPEPSGDAVSDATGEVP